MRKGFIKFLIKKLGVYYRGLLKEREGLLEDLLCHI